VRSNTGSQWSPPHNLDQQHRSKCSKEPRAIRLTDLADHPSSYGFPPGHPPMHTFLGVPISVGGEAFGNLYLTEKQGADEFSEEDEDAAVAEVAADGYLVPKANGTTHLIVKAGGQTVKIPLTVKDVDKPQPVSFRNDVMAVLSKAGCNQGPGPLGFVEPGPAATACRVAREATPAVAGGPYDSPGQGSLLRRQQPRRQLVVRL